MIVISEFKDNIINTRYNRSIIDTKHSLERFDYRYNEVDKPDVINAITNGINKILSFYKDEKGTYLIHSKSKKIGVVIDWRPDYYSASKENNAIIISILPKKSFHHAKPEDELVIVEQMIDRWASKKLEENKKKRNYETGYYDIIKSDETNSDSFYVVLYEGKLHEYNAEIIFVD